MSFIDPFSITSVSNGTNATYTVSLPIVTSEPIKAELKLEKSKGSPSLSPSIYIKHVKSKLTKIEKARLDARLTKLKKLLPYAKDMGQFALYEELSKHLAIILKEIQAEALGVTQYCEQKDVEKFLTLVKDKVVKFSDFEKFPRVIPKTVQTKVKKLRSANIFSSLKILYIDYDGKELKTTSEKIAEKDPILFGEIAFAPGRLYHIADWVDHHCDLTLERFVEKLQMNDPEFEMDQIELTETQFRGIVDDIVEKNQKLEATNRQNWREQVREEERLKLYKKSLWARLKAWWRSITTRS